MTDPGANKPEMDADFAVAARTRIDARNRERERRAAKRSGRESILLWLLAPLGLPAAAPPPALPCSTPRAAT